MSSIKCSVGYCWTKPNGMHTGVGCQCSCHIKNECSHCYCLLITAGSATNPHYQCCKCGDVKALVQFGGKR